MVLDMMSYSFYNSKKFKILLFAVFVLYSLFTLDQIVLAASGGDVNLTDALWGQGMKASWENISKFNILGKVSGWLISGLCIFGLIGTIVQKVVTFGYFGAQSFWDQVYDYQEEDAGSGFLGLKGSIQKSVSGSRGTGVVNVVIGFILSQMPNLKAWSEYNPARMGRGLNETDSVLQYALKSLFPTVCMIMFLSMGASGTLGKLYGMMADGLAAVGDNVATVNLRSYVDNVLSQTEKYKFTLAQSGTSTGKLAEEISRKIYSEVIGRNLITDKDTTIAVGLSIEKWAFKNIMGSSKDASGQRKHLATEVIGASSIDGSTSGGELTEEDIKVLDWSVVVNTSDKLNGKGFSEEMSKFFSEVKNGKVESNGEQRHVHVIIQKNRSADVNYFIKQTK
jgi:hypothetical protein